MSKTDRIDLLSAFFARDRFVEDPLLPRLFELDDLYRRTYEMYRVKSFQVARIQANKAVIEYVISEHYV